MHNYEVVDWEIVFRLCHDGIDDFRRFAQAFST
ncbi:MAG: DUF86 domain-containing protein [Alcaligenaceae bacterium]|nr:DUF86 domain-containing protein [Alcaligenaceae bacterium]